MVTVRQWILFEPVWLVVLGSLAAVAGGMALRLRLRKEKLMALFVPLALYLTAEYMAARAPEGAAVWTVLGGLAAMLFLGAVLPSALTAWNVRLK